MAAVGGDYNDNDNDLYFTTSVMRDMDDYSYYMITYIKWYKVIHPYILTHIYYINIYMHRFTH